MQEGVSAATTEVVVKSEKSTLTPALLLSEILIQAFTAYRMNSQSTSSLLPLSLASRALRCVLVNPATMIMPFGR